MKKVYRNNSYRNILNGYIYQKVSDAKGRGKGLEYKDFVVYKNAEQTFICKSWYFKEYFLPCNKAGRVTEKALQGIRLYDVSFMGRTRFVPHYCIKKLGRSYSEKYEIMLMEAVPFMVASELKKIKGVGIVAITELEDILNRYSLSMYENKNNGKTN